MSQQQQDIQGLYEGRISERTVAAVNENGKNEIQDPFSPQAENAPVRLNDCNLHPGTSPMFTMASNLRNGPMNVEQRFELKACPGIYPRFC